MTYRDSIYPIILTLFVFLVMFVIAFIYFRVEAAKEENATTKKKSREYVTRG